MMSFLSAEHSAQASRSTSALAENAFKTMAETQQRQEEVFAAIAQEQQAFTAGLFSCIQGGTSQVSQSIEVFL